MIQGIAQSPFPLSENFAISSKLDFKELSLQQIVETSKYQEILVELKKSYKTELHAHLGGAVSTDLIAKYSTIQEYSDFLSFIEKLRNGMDYSEGFKAFPMIEKVLNSNERIEEAAYEFCRSQNNDNVTFTELRTGLKRLDGKFEDYLLAVMRGLEKGMKDYPIKVTLVLSLRRNTLIEDANEMIDLAIQYRGQLLTGIDVSGESTKGDCNGIFEALKRSRDNGLPITLHIGENPLENPEQQLRELMKIKPSRVGHAVHLCQVAQSWIEDKKIIIEACIRSSLSVNMIKKPGEHPALNLFKKGHPVVFCTDDSTLFGDLSEELALVACLCDLSLEEVVGMQQKAVAYAFYRGV